MMNSSVGGTRLCARRSDRTWSPAALVQLPQLRLRHDRRNAFDREMLVRRVSSEFREIPGLCLTLPQAARLFGLPEDVCARVCEELIEDGAIQKSGRFYGAFRAEFVGAMFVPSYGQRSR